MKTSDNALTLRCITYIIPLHSLTSRKDTYQIPVKNFVFIIIALYNQNNTLCLIFTINYSFLVLSPYTKPHTLQMYKNYAYKIPVNNCALVINALSNLNNIICLIFSNSSLWNYSQMLNYQERHVLSSEFYLHR